MFDGRKFKGKLEMMIMMFLWLHICFVDYILVWGGRFYHSQKKIHETDRVKLQPQSLTDNKDKNCRGKQFKESILRDLPDFLGWVINICFEQIVIITWFRHVEIGILSRWNSSDRNQAFWSDDVWHRAWMSTEVLYPEFQLDLQKCTFQHEWKCKKGLLEYNLVFKMVMLHFYNWTEMQFHFVTILYRNLSIQDCIGRACLLFPVHQIQQKFKS